MRIMSSAPPLASRPMMAMAESEAPTAPQPIQAAGSIAGMLAGKFVSPAASFFALMYIGKGIAKILLHHPIDWEGLLDQTGYIAIVGYVYATYRAAKTNTQKTVTAAAASDIRSAQLANILTPANVTVEPSSPDPAIQHEINTQVATTARETSPNGVSNL